MAFEVPCPRIPGAERLVLLDLRGLLYRLLREQFNIVPAEAIQEFEADLPQLH